MPDYQGNRRKETFLYRRVTWPGQIEMGEYRQFHGGSIEKSAFSTIRESGTVSFKGSDAPDDHDLLRIYYRFEDDFGGSAEHALSTMRMSCSEPKHMAGSVYGEVKLYGLLQVLSDKEYGRPFTVAAGTNAVSFAKQLCEGLGLVVNATASSYKVSADHTFADDESSYLEMVNWLLSAAGYSSAWTDAYGVVQMHPYVDPTEREARFTFEDGERSIMRPEIEFTNDREDTPNVVRLFFENDDVSLWAAASNVDPSSRASLVSRRSEKTLKENVTELAGAGASEMLANLKEMALKKLLDNSSEIEYVKLDHPWIPLEPNDAVGIAYKASGIEWRGSITNMSVELKPSIPVAMKARRYVHSSLVTEVEGGMLHG